MRPNQEATGTGLKHTQSHENLAGGSLQGFADSRTCLCMCQSEWRKLLSYSTNAKTSKRDIEKGFLPPSIIIFFFFLALQCSMQDPSSPAWDQVPSALEAWLLNHWTAREVPLAVTLVASFESQKQSLAQTELRAQSALWC